MYMSWFWLVAAALLIVGCMLGYFYGRRRWKDTTNYHHRPAVSYNTLLVWVLETKEQPPERTFSLTVQVPVYGIERRDNWRVHIHEQGTTAQLAVHNIHFMGRMPEDGIVLYTSGGTLRIPAPMGTPEWTDLYSNVVSLKWQENFEVQLREESSAPV